MFQCKFPPADCNIGDSDLTYDVMLACMSPIEAQKHRTKLLESPGQSALQAGGAREAAGVKNGRAGVLELVDRGEGHHFFGLFLLFQQSSLFAFRCTCYHALSPSP